MRLKNTSRYPDAEVRALVTFGMRGVNTARLAVHVKNCRHAYRGMAYMGVPNCSPRAAQRTVDRLVTVGIGAPEKFPTDNLYEAWGRWEEWPNGADPPAGWQSKYTWERGEHAAGLPGHHWVRGPRGRIPYGGVRSPAMEYRNWQEALVAIAAHEARHIHQYQHRKPRSEVDCERFAAKRLAEFRAMGGAA